VAWGDIAKNTLKLESALAEPVRRLIELRQIEGSYYHTQSQLLAYFDRFLVEQKLAEPRLTLRHTTAMHLLRSGSDINMVSYWLGHAGINTTHIYLEIDMEMKRKMIENVDAPTINGQAPWHKPGVLEWLNELGKKPGLCAVNQERMKKNVRMERTNFT
jgi:Phage integrase family